MTGGTFANTLLVGIKIVRFWGNAVPEPDLVRFLRTFLQAQIATPGDLRRLWRTISPEYVARREVIGRLHLGGLTTGGQGNRGRAEMFRTSFRDNEIGLRREGDST
jgi:hypothetical protein